METFCFNRRSQSGGKASPLSAASISTGIQTPAKQMPYWGNTAQKRLCSALWAHCIYRFFEVLYDLVSFKRDQCCKWIPAWLQDSKITFNGCYMPHSVRLLNSRLVKVEIDCLISGNGNKPIQIYNLIDFVYTLFTQTPCSEFRTVWSHCLQVYLKVVRLVPLKSILCYHFCKISFINLFVQQRCDRNKL